MAELIRAARSGRGKLCWYVAPSYAQAKTILWAALKSAIPAGWVERKNEVDLSLTLKGYDSTISLKSADRPDSLRGSGLNLIILDEYASMDPVVWSAALRPALSDRRGHALILGSPRGFDHLHSIYNQALETDDWAAFHVTTAQGGLVTPDEIEAVKAQLDPVTFGQEFEADFTTSTARVYTMFRREFSVRADLTDPDEHVAPLPAHLKSDAIAREQYAQQRVPLLCGLDFNVDPMSAILGVKVVDELHVLHEIVLHNSNTTEMCTAITEQFPGRKIIVFPDPTGNSRKSSAPVGSTDFTLIRQSGFTLIAPRAPYPVVDKVNTVNSLLCSASGRRRLFVHPRCKRLIESLEKLSYRADSRHLDKSAGFDHLTDALAYICLSQFPLQHGRSWAEIRGVW